MALKEIADKASGKGGNEIDQAEGEEIHYDSAEPHRGRDQKPEQRKQQEKPGESPPEPKQETVDRREGGIHRHQYVAEEHRGPLCIG